ncbi:MAG: polyprenyl synthetase family protein [Bacteroidota bacterium]|nr:polyprenyl synthetase family protein [Bacteroidota bacterium]MDX5427251.1 polyprenyl synthetase family protein [Bacteroidota bacterium]MDX5505205.1 polyprenyl synthetase family protein [Bacteroidota bacterium]
MSKLQEIKRPIASEMEAFEPKFRASMASRVALLDKITHYIVKRKGKQMRPMLVFLSAKLVGEVRDSTYLGASLIELMHTATLVHDDVVDDANQRRGFFSINALWKNKIAVLVGDYLLSKVLLLAVKNKEYGLLEIVSGAVQQMSEGELLQIEKARRLDIDESVYYEIIQQKTASLIATCCAAGAHSTGVENEVVEKLYEFGRNIGMAFQIKDDLFDYQLTNRTGKPSGIDIKEQKMTLPLIYAINNADRKTKKWLINSVKNHHNDPDRVEEVVKYVLKSGGIEYAEKRMNDFKEVGLRILSEFPNNEAKISLLALTEYVIERTK